MRRILGTLVALFIVMSLVLMPVSAVSADDGDSTKLATAYQTGLTGEGLGKDCTFDHVKWQDNPNSWHLYLQHWGKTPTTAMSRLAGLCGPDALCGSNCYDGAIRPLNTGNMVNGCYGNCATCNEETGSQGSCPDSENCETEYGMQGCPAGCESSNECRSDAASARCYMSDGQIYTAKCNGCWGVSTAFANTSWQNSYLGSHSRLNDSHPNHRGVENTTFGGDWGTTGSNHPECASKIWALQCNMKVGRASADSAISRGCGDNCIDGCVVE